MMTEEEFLAAPREEVKRVAPQAMVYAAAGTRRQAALAGVDVDGEAYPAWARLRMLEACQLLFDHGVQHIFTLLAGPSQFREVGNYRKRLLDWIAWGTGSEEALADFRSRNWQVRLCCGEELPQLAGIQERLLALRGDPQTTLWFQVIADAEAPWRWVLDATGRCQARTRPQAIRALYGEEVPPVTLFLGFGKPVISPELLPPLLAGAVQCYWSQRPGYSLTEGELRRLLYDFAFTRTTWHADKTGRAQTAGLHAAAWENGPLLGLGMAMGPFWYPRASAQPAVQAPDAG